MEKPTIFRIPRLMALTDDLARLETQKRDVAIQHLLIINQEKALEESRVKLEAAKSVLNASLDRIDAAFLSLYQVTPAPVAVAAIIDEPKKQRSKKVKEVEAPTPLKKCNGNHALNTPCEAPQCWHGEDNPHYKGSAAEANLDEKSAQRLAILADPAATPCAKCHAASECSDCCKVCISPCDTKQVCRTDNPAEAVGVCAKCEGEGMYIEDGIEDGGGETYCDCPAGIALKEKDAAVVPADSADVEKQEEPPRETEAPASFQPLDEPVGNCELCMGYGVIDGELYGESTLVPCKCPAGLKVKGGDLTGRPCDNCNIEDPDCASCHLPDMEAPFEVEEPHAAELPKCANGSCTANDPLKGEYCLRISLEDRPGKDCKSLVPLDQCKHDLTKRIKNADGSVTCGVCDAVIRPAGSVDPATGKTAPKEEPKAATQLTALQQRCTHPKAFREETPDGIVCKVCKLNLSQPGLF